MLPPQPIGALPAAVCGPNGSHKDQCLRTIPPRENGGNMDVQQMQIGTTLLLPCFTDGCGLFVGDVHFAQGDGEVSGTAIEMGATVTVRTEVLKGRGSEITSPHFEGGAQLKTIAPENFYATVGFPLKAKGEVPPFLTYLDGQRIADLENLSEDLSLAARAALIEMIDYLERERGLSREQAYILSVGRGRSGGRPGRRRAQLHGLGDHRPRGVRGLSSWRKPQARRVWSASTTSRSRSATSIRRSRSTGGCSNSRCAGAAQSMAFIDMGDQFIALSTGRTQAKDEDRHFGLVVDDRAPLRQALEEMGAEILPGRGLDFIDPWGNHIQVVEYRGHPVHQGARGAARHGPRCARQDRGRAPGAREQGHPLSIGADALGVYGGTKV